MESFNDYQQQFKDPKEVAEFIELARAYQESGIGDSFHIGPLVFKATLEYEP